MEEQVGQLWHRLITGLADSRHPRAVVHLQDVAATVGVLFRALGGDGGLRVEAAEASATAARRGWLQRIAGSGKTSELAWRDELSLRLPARIDCFPDAALNRDLYLWLAALAAGDSGDVAPWFEKNQRLTRRTLHRFPGMRGRYRRLVQAHLGQRPDPGGLPGDEAVQEGAIRSALIEPGSGSRLPVARHAPYPVPLWLHPSPPWRTESDTAGDAEGAHPSQGRTRRLREKRRRRAERVDKPEEDRGLVTIRMENIFTWGDFARVDRGVDENEDLEQAAAAADDMDRLSVTRDGKSIAGRLKFDLDLPGSASDDLVLGEGILLPEWDYKRQCLLPDHCRLVSMVAADAEPRELPPHLSRTAKRLRAQFQQLLPARVWRRAQPDGSEIDLDAYLRFRADRAAGYVTAGDALYLDLRAGARDLACLLLADLSLSTDTWVSDRARVIDVIRDSLFLFAESLAATGDRFALYGFSSRKRDPVRYHQIKTFEQPYNAAVRGRIQAIKPGYYTRMGAAIRRAIALLEAEPAERRLLLILTDGKPNDLDKYEGRYGVEDTRRAVHEARQAGLQPFCVTVDEQGSDYLPYLFGGGGFLVIRRPQELPRKLPLLYARLTA